VHLFLTAWFDHNAFFSGDALWKPNSQNRHPDWNAKRIGESNFMSGPKAV